MSYFHVYTLTRFCLTISASLFMLSAFSCSIRGVDTQEKFVIEFLPGITQKFKTYCVDAVNRGISQTELREGLFEFAKEGESSAAHTLWRSYQGKTLQGLEVEVRKFASPKNPYACNLLGSFLADQKNPECLEWYQIYDLNFTGEDPDFRGNYASAILRLKQPLNVETLKDAWRLLRVWRETDKTNSNDVLEGLYLALTKAAIEIKATEFLCDLYVWASNCEDSAIRRGINLSIIQNVEFLDIVSERTKIIPFAIDSRNSLSDETHRVMQQAKAYLERNQNNRQTVAGIVWDNLAAMLQDTAAVRDIPFMNENARYFSNFRGDKPTEKHLESWAILTINKHRARLTETSDQDIVVQEMAKKIRNDTLKKYAFAGFRAIYGYD